MNLLILVMKLPKLLIISCCIFLFGCKTIEPVTILDSTKKEKIVIDVNLLKSCGTLIDNLEYGITFQDVLAAKIKDAYTFAECKKLNESKKKLLEEYLLNGGQ